MLRFEYKRCQNWEDVVTLGADGWELVGVTPDEQGGSWFYLKRTYPSIREQITQEQRTRALQEAGD
ncbi:MAG: hypothetical protein JWN30_1672 [Bacilli bacterium]|nr:hypothetical protein [Bacilli bacterium]